MGAHAIKSTLLHIILKFVLPKTEKCKKETLKNKISEMFYIANIRIEKVLENS